MESLQPSKPPENGGRQCLGITKRLRRCKRKGSWPWLCDEHRSRTYLIPIVLTFLVGFVGILSGLIEIKNEWIKREAGSRGSVGIDITLYEENRSFPASQYPSYSGSSPHNNVLKFSYYRDEGNLRIGYELPYLTLLSRGGPIEPFSAFGSELKKPLWRFPRLAVKVVNNTDRTLLLTEASIDILSSEVNKEPVLVIQSGNLGDRKYLYNGEVYIIDRGTFHLVNEGWGDVINATVDYKAKAARGNILHSGETTGSIRLGTFSDRAEVRITPNLQGEKYDLSTDIKSQFLDVSGTIKYLTETNESRSVRFKTKVFTYLLDEIQGTSLESSFYDVLLDAGKSGYIKYVPIAQEVKPGATDHFVFQLGSNKSSRFDLKLSLRGAGGVNIPSKRILVDIFTPRSVEWMVLEEEDVKKYPNLQQHRRMKRLTPQNQ